MNALTKNNQVGQPCEAEEEIEEILTDEAKDRMNYELIEEKYFD